MKAFDWHSDTITRDTPITSNYRNTQRVRRFFREQCGDHFKFDRPFMAWLKRTKNKTMGDAVKRLAWHQTNCCVPYPQTP